MEKFKLHTAIQMITGLLLTGTSYAGWQPGYGMYSGGHMMGGGYMGWTMIFFWVMVLFIIILLIRWLLNLTQTQNSPQAPLDILKQRLARGDIDIEEFEQKKQLL